MRNHNVLRRLHSIVALTTALGSLSIPMVAGAQQDARVHPPAVIAVSPGKFDIEIGNRPTVQSLRLFNLGDSDVEVQATVANWVLDDNNSVVVMEPTEQSLDQWIVVNPVRFTIPARSSQTVRFAVRPRVEPEPGEHRAMLYFEQILPEDRSPNGLYVNFKVGVAVYGNAGEIDRVPDLHGINVVSDDSVFAARFDISSNGNAHVRMDGQYAVWSVNSFPGAAAMIPIADVDRPGIELPPGVVAAGTLPNVPVLAGTRREVALAVRHGLTPGEYVFAALGTVSGQEFREMTRFVVPSRVDSSVASRENRH